MPREFFAGQLTKLHTQSVILGEQACTAVDQAIQAFCDQDLALARRVVDEDAGINRYEQQVLDLATELLTLQAPVAIDLRRILGISRVANYYERIGDHARDIAAATIRAAGAPPLGALTNLPSLLDSVIATVHAGLRAYESGDPEAARALSAGDDAVDHVYADLFRELLDAMNADSTLAARGAYTLFVAHHLERIADYTADIGKAVVYIATGSADQLQ